MNQARYYIRVGITLLVGVALFVAFLLFLNGTLNDLRSYGFQVEFQDARGITKGATVNMAGVRIGRVVDVSLTKENRAMLRLRIDKQYVIPRGSRFVITTGILASTPELKVEPAAGTTAIGEDEPGLKGEEAAGLASAFEQSERLLQSFQRTADAVEKIATNPQVQRDLTATLRNVRVATEGLPALSRNIEAQLALLTNQTSTLLGELGTATASGGRVARNAERLTGDLQATLTENRATLRSLLENTDGTVSAIRGLTEQLEATLNSDTLQQNLTASTQNLRSITTRLDTITGNIERLSSDPRLNADIRETVTNLKETSASVRALADRIEGIRFPGERRRAETPGETPPPRPRATALAEPGPVVDTLYDTDRERLRLDANFTLLGSQNRFYRAGIYDLTESNKFNLQFGQTQGGTALRYGLIAGKLGGGLDIRTGPVDLRFDLYDPNRLTLNLRARARVSGTTSALLGIDSVGNGNRAILGIQIRQ